MVSDGIPVTETGRPKSANFWFDRLLGGLELLFAILGLVPVALMAMASYGEASLVPGTSLPLWQGCAALAVLLALHVWIGVEFFKGRRRGMIGFIVLTLAPIPFALVAGSLALVAPSLLLVVGCALRLGGWGPRPV